MSRQSPPEGALNFRDLGGMHVAQNMKVKPRKLFRSGRLSMLSTNGLKSLAAIGLNTIFDLRSSREREREPYHWHTSLCINYAIQDYELSGASMAELLRISDTAVGRVREEMLQVYRELPIRMAPSYSALLRALADGKLPVLFGCTGGKDRTGVAAGIVLHLLGASVQDIFTDYRASIESLESLRAIVAEDLQASLDCEKLRPLLDADPEYLAASLDAIDREFGTLENYVTSRLDISNRQIDSIRANLLETVSEIGNEDGGAPHRAPSLTDRSIP